MSIPNSQTPENNYDSRWFIWTIVFLVATGISLVSYITLSGVGDNDSLAPSVVAHHTAAPK
jgi:hypothetical protein